MHAITCKQIARYYTNNGQHAEQMLAYTLTGELRKAYDLRFDVASDIPEYHMSVKSDHATLVSGSHMVGDTFASQLKEYFERTASTSFAYVTNEGVAYIMNAREFEQFIVAFGSWEKESEKNGGGHKIRIKHESKKMLRWLNAKLAD